MRGHHAFFVITVIADLVSLIVEFGRFLNYIRMTIVAS